MTMPNNIQLTHADHKPLAGKFPLSIIANDILSPLNVGSLFRLCDAFGIKKLYLCGDTAMPPNTKINKTSRSTENHVNFDAIADAKKLITELKISGSFIISLEITCSSLSISSGDFVKAIHNKKSICLILGSENSGINEDVLLLSDIIVHIPMYGNNSSMNVISAASIACYEITRNMKTQVHNKPSSP